MDGYELCQRLKASEKNRDIPVIFISGLEDTIDKVKAFATLEVIARVANQLQMSQKIKALKQF